MPAPRHRCDSRSVRSPNRRGAAIGESIVVDTAKDQRLGRIFLNRTIKLYPSLSGFFGMEKTLPTRSPLLQVRRRLQHLCSQPSRRRTASTAACEKSPAAASFLGTVIKNRLTSHGRLPRSERERSKDITPSGEAAMRSHCQDREVNRVIARN